MRRLSSGATCSLTWCASGLVAVARCGGRCLRRQPGEAEGVVKSGPLVAEDRRTGRLAVQTHGEPREALLEEKRVS